MKLLIITISSILIATTAGDVGITFSGGGFRAHAVATGVVAGLANTAGDGQTKLTELFKHTDLIGSNSGGSWFFSQLGYSSNFVNMIGLISDQNGNTKNASSIYYDQWVVPFITNPRISRISAFSDSNGIIEDLIGRVLEILGIGQSWFMLISNVIRAGLTWQDFVQSIIDIPGDVNSTASLAFSTPNSWCMNKIWAIAGAIVSPSTSNKHGGFGAFSSNCDSTANSFTYKVKETFSAGISIPVTFSTVMGSQSASPFPFIPETTTLTPTYDIMSKPSLLYPLGRKARTIDFNETVVPGPGMNSNKVSLHDAVATSSAFLAQVLSIYESLNPYISIIALVPGLLTAVLDLTVRFAAHPSVDPQAAFYTGEQLVNPRNGQSCSEWHEDVAKNHVMTLSDGGYIDNTAISNIVASASNNSDITVVMNTKSMDINDYYTAFQSDVDGIDVVFTRLPIFEQTKTFAKEMFETTFASLKTVADASVLNTILFGSVPVITSNQPYFGIQAGKHLLVNFVIVDTNMDLVALDWKDPAKLVGEISSTFQSSENLQAVETIKSWLH